MALIITHSTLGGGASGTDGPVSRPSGAAGSPSFALLENPNLGGPSMTGNDLRSRPALASWRDGKAQSRTFADSVPEDTGKVLRLQLQSYGDADLLL